MNNKIIYTAILVAIFLSCNIPSGKDKEENTFITATNCLELDKRLNDMDSLVFVFYKDPYGEDSLRYTRYYTQTPVTDSNDLSLMLKNLGWEYTKFEKVKNCRSEGKIWCYSKGSIFQTVYFSTRCDDCCFLYIIKDGFFFYMKLEKSFSDRITALKLISGEIEN